MNGVFEWVSYTCARSARINCIVLFPDQIFCTKRTFLKSIAGSPSIGKTDATSASRNEVQVQNGSAANWK